MTNVRPLKYGSSSAIAPREGYDGRGSRTAGAEDCGQGLVALLEASSRGGAPTQEVQAKAGGLVSAGARDLAADSASRVLGHAGEFFDGGRTRDGVHVEAFASAAGAVLQFLLQREVRGEQRTETRP